MEKGQAMRGRTIIVIAALVAAGVYVAFKDDITQIWDSLPPRSIAICSMTGLL